jgi:glycosyltransferase involved in cell wall biosynthesis
MIPMDVEQQARGPRGVTSEGGVGVVIIGRNEGERLRRCFESIVPMTTRIIYVDSGSTDGSVEMARRRGAIVIELDTSIPFCAARARNAGYQKLIESHPQLNYVQFVDGDCEIVGGWLSFATDALLRRPDLAIVAGWLREKFPEISIYNRLGDFEWNSSGTGEVDAVGGIFMIRRQAFDSVGGFDPTVAAGEEPELCQRLIRKGWRLVRLDRDMALHDLAMTRFGQWWKRQVRTGYGGLDVDTRFGLPGYKRITYRARFWSAWPLFVLGISTITGFVMGPVPAVIVALLTVSIWPAQLCRIALRAWHRGNQFTVSVAYAFFTMISFWPQMVGQLLYWNDRLTKRRFRLLEHKTNCGTRSGRSK